MKKKTYRSVTLRSLSTLLMGAIIIAFPTNATVYLIMAIGLLFLIPGLTSIFTYIRNRRQVKAIRDSGETIRYTGQATYFPLIGTGSVLFGIILLCFPSSFKLALIYILGSFLVIAAVAQAINIYKLSKLYITGFVPYVVSIMIALAGIAVIWLNYNHTQTTPRADQQEDTFTLPSLVFAIACLVYGISEIAFTLYFRNPKTRAGSQRNKLLPSLKEEQSRPTHTP